MCACIPLGAEAAVVVLEGRAMCHGPFQLSGWSAVRSPAFCVWERSLWHSVLELDLLETGPWWKPSLHNTFSHLQAVVTGTVQEPSTTFCRCLARRLQIWRTRLNSSCFNWRQCCGSVDQWVGDDLVSSQPCSLVIAPQGCVVKGFLEAVSIRVAGVERWICSPRSW